MNRNTTVLVLCGLFLLADILCVDQMIEIRAELSAARLAVLIFGQVMFAVFLGSIAYTVFRKTYARQKKPVSRQGGYAILQPLRRLFVSVWS